MSYDIVIAATYSLRLNPAVRNRLTVLANQVSNNGKSIAIVSVDDERLDELSLSVDHVFLNIEQKKSSNFLKRAASEFYLSLNVLRAAKKLKGRTTVVSVPSVMALPASYFVWIPNITFDLRDIVWEYLPNTSFLDRAYKFFLKKICIFRLRLSKKILCTNSSEYEYLISSGLKKEKLKVLPNGLSRSKFEQLAAVTSSRKTGAPVRVTYAGNLGLAQNIIFFVDLAKKLPSVEFNIYGEGIQRNKIKQKLIDEGIKNCNIHPFVSWSELITVYSQSDVLFAQITSDYKLAVPSKVFEYLATGKKIIFGCEGAVKKLIVDLPGVKCISPNSSLEFERAISEISETEDATNEGVLIRKNVAKSYIREKSISRLVSSGFFDENI